MSRKKTKLLQFDPPSQPLTPCEPEEWIEMERSFRGVPRHETIVKLRKERAALVRHNKKLLATIQKITRHLNPTSTKK